MTAWELLTQLAAFAPDAEVTIAPAGSRSPAPPVARVPIAEVRCDDPNRALVHVELVAGLSLGEQEQRRQQRELRAALHDKPRERGERADS